jgi:hypothetical protein
MRKQIGNWKFSIKSSWSYKERIACMYCNCSMCHIHDHALGLAALKDLCFAIQSGWLFTVSCTINKRFCYWEKTCKKTHKRTLASFYKHVCSYTYRNKMMHVCMCPEFKNKFPTNYKYSRTAADPPFPIIVYSIRCRYGLSQSLSPLSSRRMLFWYQWRALANMCYGWPQSAHGM